MLHEGQSVGISRIMTEFIFCRRPGREPTVGYDMRYYFHFLVEKLMKKDIYIARQRREAPNQFSIYASASIDEKREKTGRGPSPFSAIADLCRKLSRKK